MNILSSNCMPESVYLNKLIDYNQFFVWRGQAYSGLGKGGGGITNPSLKERGWVLVRAGSLFKELWYVLFLSYNYSYFLTPVL